MNRLDAYHIPVLLDEIVAHLLHRPDGVYLDGTLGGGGHFWSMALKLSDKASLFGIDRDPYAVAWNRERALKVNPRVVIAQSRFSEFDAVLREHAIPAIDGLLLDLGVSSRQIDDPDRGFTYQLKSSLDMRMDPAFGQSARDLIRYASEDDLARIIRDFGEIPQAKGLARLIKLRDAEHALETSSDLRACVNDVFGQHTGVKIVARLFQALRIAVNDELGELQRFLGKVTGFLKPGARLAIIAYHSLEDRMVKEFARNGELQCICPPEVPFCRCNVSPTFKRITKKALRPAAAELASNPRSRSARLRIMERTESAG